MAEDRLHRQRLVGSQTSTAAPSGGYAFSAFGVDANGQAAGIEASSAYDSPGAISGTGLSWI